MTSIPPSRRDMLKGAVAIAAASAATIRGPHRAHGQGGAMPGRTRIDGVLRQATDAKEVPGVVAMAATDKGLFYEGAFGTRDLAKGPAMTLDSVFRIASMTKAIASVAAMQLVEQGKLKLEDPVPNIDPALGSPQVLEGFDAAGAPKLRPAKRPITLRHLLTHTAGFSYEIWDENTVRYVKVSGMPSTATGKIASIRMPLAFDPGDKWEYGVNIDWVGRLVESISGQPLDVYFREKIFAPLGMKDTGYVTSTEQRARQAIVHQRQADGSLVPQPLETPFTPEFWSAGGPPLLDGPGLSRVSPDAAERGKRERRAHPAARDRRPHGQEPHRQYAVRGLEDGHAHAVERRRFLSRGRDPLGAGLHAQHAAGAERAKRGHGELGRDLQHLLLARPVEACDGADHDAGPAFRRPARGKALRAVRRRGLRVAEGVKFGVWIPNCRHLATPGIIRGAAVRAEQLGYESVWVSDHVVVPRANIVNFGETIFDPLVTLGVIAGATSRVQLGTTVLIVPYRNAVVTAKMISSLDALSGGRFVFGIGAGWVAAESAMLGVPFAERGAMTDEYLEAMRELWTSATPSFAGKYTQFSDLVFEPKPVQKPHPPIWVGGHSRAALRRTARFGAAWHPINRPPAELRAGPRRAGAALRGERSRGAARAHPAQ